MSEARETYLEERVKALTEKVEGLKEQEQVLMTYIAMVLQAFGCTSEETGIDLDINQISQSLGKFEVIGVPTGGAEIRMFAREKTTE